MNLLHEIFLGNEKSFTRRVAVFHAAILFAAVAFLYLFSYSTSPRYFFIGSDSLIFQAVGFCWAEGQLPYIGMFENKGPLIFAIDALGYLIYPRYGIFPLQIPFMYFSLLFTWRAVELYWSRSATVKILLFTIFVRAEVFAEGNRTEEYSMPFLLAAGYFFLRWLKEEKNFCPPSLGFFYGFGFGVCVLLRATNSLPICCYVLLTTFFLIRSGAFKNICQNFLSFWAGFAIICLPFVLYFAAHDALYDMLYGTILLNVKHATGYDTHSAGYYEYMEPYVMQYFQPLLWLIGASIFLHILDRKNKLAWSGFVVGAAMFFMLIKSRPFIGYYELIASLLPIFFAVVFELKTKLATVEKNVFKITYKLLFVVFLTGVGIQVAVLYSYFTFLNSDKTIAEIKLIQTVLYDFQLNIPADEKNSVVCWGEANAMSNFILETNIKPRCRFFGNINSAFGKLDPAVIDEWIETVRRNSPKWIVYNALQEEFSDDDDMDYFDFEFRRQRNSDVEKVLREKYVLKATMFFDSRETRLYRLRE